MEPDAIVRGLERWCDQHQVAKDGVLVITIQRNRTTEFASVVADLSSGTILANYPAEVLTKYDEMRAGDLLVCYKAGLALPDVSTAPTPTSTPTDGPFGFPPSELIPFKPRRTAQESAFTNFLTGKGNLPHLVFEVKKQIDNGPLISTKYYTLVADVITELEGPFVHKVHCFKNYKVGGFFFGVDLYRVDGQTGGNYHHMRLNPFTKLNTDILAALFAHTP
jgi:hypothetical protein